MKELKEMINLMNENSLNELEVEKEGLRIRLKKGVGGTHEQDVEVVRSARALPAEQPPPIEKKNTVEIKSPMVGTLYRSPSPEAEAYVKIGDTIEIGQVICIIEAMKLMNEIKSEVRGKIVDIPVDNGQPVEFGQALIVVEIP
ncbi:MAG: acetyl-CoA carboxylase biotin carboxyl carrier protein [Candidatus Omnitrophota bacterium]